MKKLIIISEEQKNRLLKEYSTPDRINIGNINLGWHCGEVYPFVQVKDEVVVGKENQMHSDMKSQILAAIANTTEDIVKDIQNDYYGINEDEETGEITSYTFSNGEELDAEKFDDIWYYVGGDGRCDTDYYCRNYGRIWPNAGDDYETYVSLWLNSRNEDDYYDDSYYDDEEEENMFQVDNDNQADSYTDCLPKKLSKDQLETIKKVLDYFQCEYNNSYVLIGERMFSFQKLWTGEEIIQISQSDIDAMNDAKANHLRPAEEKWKNTEAFRQNRDKQLGKKLTMSNGKEMPIAQYHNMIYQEGKKKRKTF